MPSLGFAAGADSNRAHDEKAKADRTTKQVVKCNWVDGQPIR
jgi:hypothetical protein